MALHPDQGNGTLNSKDTPSFILEATPSPTDLSGGLLEYDKELGQELYECLKDDGVDVPIDVNGEPIFSLNFIRNLPQNIQPRAAEIAREILDAFDGSEGRRLSKQSDEGSEDDEDENEFDRELQEKLENIVLGLRYSPEGVTYVADDNGTRVKYERMLLCLKNAYSESELKKHEEFNREKDATLKASIREERRHEDKDPDLKKASSDIEMHQMAMRFIPEYNPRPGKSDPLNLFEYSPKPLADTLATAQQGHHKGVEFIHILEPSFALGRLDSLATVPSTVARRFSNDSVRGSALSTRLSDMPSMFSQALVEEPSQAIVSTPSTQDFNINSRTVSAYREKWLTSFMSGFTPKQTLTISILNMITRKQIELRVCKENTMNEICHMYMQYEDHPEYYVWKDIYGRILIPEKTLVENGLMRQDEILEFHGYRRLPVILLYFRDGFENEPPLPLNPLHALKQREPGLCRNY